jgi:hypothetical protein
LALEVNSIKVSWKVRTKIVRCSVVVDAHAHMLLDCLLKDRMLLNFSHDLVSSVLCSRGRSISILWVMKQICSIRFLTTVQLK